MQISPRKAKLSWQALTSFLGITFSPWHPSSLLINNKLTIVWWMSLRPGLFVCFRLLLIVAECHMSMHSTKGLTQPFHNR